MLSSQNRCNGFFPKNRRNPFFALENKKKSLNKKKAIYLVWIYSDRDNDFKINLANNKNKSHTCRHNPQWANELCLFFRSSSPIALCDFICGCGDWRWLSTLESRVTILFSFNFFFSSFCLVFFLYLLYAPAWRENPEKPPTHRTTSLAIGKASRLSRIRSRIIALRKNPTESSESS